MRVSKEVTVSQLADLVDARVEGNGDVLISGVATLESAEPTDISFLANPKYQKFLSTSKAGAVLVSEASVDACASVAIVCADPYLAYARITSFLTDEDKPESGTHNSAIVDPAATIHPTAIIDAYAVIEAGAVIGEDTWVGAGCYVGKNVVIGKATRLFPNVNLYEKVELGDHCRIHSGAVIGADGFGIAKDGDQWMRIPQIGGVKVGNNVDVGANTTIDCGALEPTVIEDGVKLDDQIHIAHNCRIGENTAIAAETGIAGSTIIGKNCTIGGGSGFNGHITVCDNVFFTGMSMVTKSITKPGMYSSGMPVQESAQWRKNTVLLRQMEKMREKLKKLEAQIAKLGVDD